MMMDSEQNAELQAKAQPLMELLVEVLNELNDLGGQRVVINHNEILAAGGTVAFHPWTRRWQIGTRR